MNVEVFDFNLGITPEDALKHAYNGEQIRKSNATIPWKNDEEIYHPAELEGIEIMEGETVTIRKGSMVRLHLSSIPSIATLPLIAWMSSDQNIAVVDSNGIVRGISEGEVTVTAVNIDDNKMTAEITATVTSGSEPGPGPEPGPHDYSKDYFTFRALEANSTVSVPVIDDDATLLYSVDGGESWSEAGTSTNITLNNVDDVVLFKGNNPNDGGYNESAGLLRFGGSGKLSVEGNIMSLLYEDEFEDKDTLIYFVFALLFSQNLGIVDASNLILPATTLTEGCYYQMFQGCTNLTSAPELPAETLYFNCYYGMFHGCTSLTTAPELPATNLVQDCYYGLFYGCSNLNYIKCLATNLISAQGCTTAWVNGVQTESGTFVKNPDMSNWTTGRNGIPGNWTVEDAEI